MKKGQFEEIYSIGLSKSQAKLVFHLCMNERDNVLDGLALADISEHFQRFLEKRLSDLDIITDALYELLILFE